MKGEKPMIFGMFVWIAGMLAMVGISAGIARVIVLLDRLIYGG